MKRWPWDSKQPNCTCLLPSSEAVGNTQTIESISASRQEVPARDAGRKMIYLSSFNTARTVPCQSLPQQINSVEGSGL